ncbi:unnamed protein product [Prunus armeniaca]
MLMTRASLCGMSRPIRSFFWKPITRSSSASGKSVETWEIIMACLIFLFFSLLVSLDSSKSARIVLILMTFWGGSLAVSRSSIGWMACFAMNSVQ